MRLSDTNHEIYLARDDGTRLASIEEAYRFEYVRKVNDIGAFEIVLPGDFDKNLVEAGADRRVEFWRKPLGGIMQQEWQYFIQTTTWEYDEEGVERLRISGPSVNDLLTRRILVMYTTMTRVQKSDYADDMMKEVVYENMGGGVGVATGRQINPAYFGIASDWSLGPVVTLDFPWENQFDVLIKIADAARAKGTPVYFDIVPISQAQLQFQTFVNQRGADRREGFSARPVIFGLDYGNLERPRLTIDYEPEKSLIYASGVGSGFDQYFVGWSEATRSNRSIFAMDEGHVSSQADTVAKLNDLAVAELYRLDASLGFEGWLKDTPGAQYGHHWFYGDWVTINAFGIQMDAKIESMRIVVDENGLETLEACVEKNV